MPSAARIVDFAPSAESIALHDACVLVSASDHAGVQTAARNLAGDLSLILGKDVPFRVVEEDDDGANAPAPLPRRNAIVVGSLDASALLKDLVDEGKVAVDEIAGKWEAFQTCVVDAALPGASVDAALVIAGSDRRGASFGAYALSEQAGVSP